MTKPKPNGCWNCRHWTRDGAPMIWIEQAHEDDALCTLPRPEWLPSSLSTLADRTRCRTDGRHCKAWAAKEDA